MKKTIVTLSTLFLISIAFAQSNRTTGPAAKNAKVWEKSSQPTQLVYHINKKEIKGAEAKNQHIWEMTDQKEKVILSRKNQLKGPAAKNRKPWN